MIDRRMGTLAGNRQPSREVYDAAQRHSPAVAEVAALIRYRDLVPRLVGRYPEAG
jgi:hypothetical protein